MEVEVRVHKLLILVGQEGASFQSRDFNKVVQVIVDEYLSQSNQTFSDYLVEILSKVIMLVPLKQHIYAGLTAKISNKYTDISNRIIQKNLSNLQMALNSGKFYQSINIVTYFSELMNLSLFNSLSFMNLLQDIMQNLESSQKQKRFYGEILIRTLPTFIYSMNQKVFHDLKKLLEKLLKFFPHSMLLNYIMKMHTKGNIIFYEGKLSEGSQLYRLQHQFQNIIQNSPKFKLKLTSFEKWQPIQYYQNIEEDEDQLFKQFYREQGQIHKYKVQQLIQQFYSNSQILVRKLSNYLNSVSAHNQVFLYKTIILVLIAKCLKSHKPIVEQYLLISITNFSEQNTKLTQADVGKMIQSKIQNLFGKAESFDFNGILSFVNLCSFLCNNWKFEWDWEKFIQNQDKFNKREIILKLILQKVRFLNDKFVLPKTLEPFSQFQTPQKITNQQEYQNVTQMEKFQKIEADLKNKLSAEQVIKNISNQTDYQIFLEALFRRTSLSQTHLQVLMKRYEAIFNSFKEFDWTLINKIRNFWKFSYFHRHLYLQFIMFKNQFTTFNSYASYIGELSDKNEKDMIQIKVQLTQLKSQFIPFSQKKQKQKQQQQKMKQ